MHSFETRLATSTADREAAYRLRHRIYVREMGLLPEDHPYCRDGMLVDPFDERSDILVLWADGCAVGTVRLTVAAMGPLELETQRTLGDVMEPREAVAEVTRLMIDRRYRCMPAARSLYLALFQRMLAHDLRRVVIAGKLGRLGRLYRNMGFRCVDPDVFEYDVVPGSQYQLLALELGTRHSWTRWYRRAFFGTAAWMADVAPGGPNWIRRGMRRAQVRPSHSLDA